MLGTDVHETAPAGQPGDYLRLDVRRDDDWAAAVAWVDERWGGLDLLVNNAGVASGGRIDTVPTAEWQWIVDINLLGVARGCFAVTPLFKRQRAGHLVNIASMAGLVHPPTMSAYVATKAGVVGLSESLRYELEPWGITTSVVCPSFFRTNLADSLRDSDPVTAAMARSLLSDAPADAAAIAARVIVGIDRCEHVIITDPEGRRALWGKRWTRALYDREMARRARQVYQAETARRESR